MKRKRIYILIFYTLLFPYSAYSQQLSLDTCLSLAKRNNYSLRQARNNIEKAKEVKQQALTKYFPQVGLSAFCYAGLNPLLQIGIDDAGNAGARDILNTIYQTYGSTLGLTNPYSIVNQYGVMASAMAVQPIYMGGKIVAGNKLAQIGVEAAELQQQMAERDKLLQVEESYWLCVSLKEKQQTLNDMQSLLDTLYQTVNTAVEAGLVMNNDLLRVQLKMDETNTQKLQLSNGIRLAIMALCQSVGIDYSDSIVLTDTMQALDSVSWFSITDTSYVRPEQQLLSLNVRAEQLQKRMAVADALPKVVAGASYYYTNAVLDRHSHNGVVSVAVQVPLTAWWETSHKIREHNRNIENAQWQQQDYNEQLQLQSIQDLTAVEESRLLIEQHQRSVATAQENYRIALLAYENGLQTIAELLEAQTLLSAAKNQLTDAQISYRINLRRLNTRSRTATKE